MLMGRFFLSWQLHPELGKGPQIEPSSRFHRSCSRPHYRKSSRWSPDLCKIGGILPVVPLQPGNALILSGISAAQQRRQCPDSGPFSRVITVTFGVTGSPGRVTIEASNFSSSPSAAPPGPREYILHIPQPFGCRPAPPCWSLQTPTRVNTP